MNNKSNFNKEEFAALLEKAKGDRSINKYAEETSVSAAHISRFLRAMIDSPLPLKLYLSLQIKPMMVLVIGI